MLIKTGYENLLHGCDIFVFTWWIINEFEKCNIIFFKYNQNSTSIDKIRYI